MVFNKVSTYFRVAENHWRSIHAAKAEKAAEERERKRRELKERIKEIEVSLDYSISVLQTTNPVIARP